MPCIPFALRQLLNFKLSLSSISYQTLSGPNKVRPHTCNCSQSSKSLRLQTNTSKGHSQCMAPDRQTDRLVHVLTDLVVEGSPSQHQGDVVEPAGLVFPVGLSLSSCRELTATDVDSTRKPDQPVGELLPHLQPLTVEGRQQ